VFIVVRDPALRATIGAITARVWEGGARALESDRLSPSFLRDVDQGAMGGIAGAPVLIVVCGDTRLTYPQSMDSSVFPAVQNLLLAAHALGLGSTLTTMPLLGGRDLTEPLGLPPEVVPVAVIPLGHLTRPLAAPRRLPLSQKAHLNRYGTPFP
jgi:nitroreductase